MNRRLFGVIVVFILLGGCGILPTSQKPLFEREYTPDTFFTSLDWSQKDIVTLDGNSTKDPMYPFFIGNTSTGRVIPVLVNHQLVSGNSAKISPNGRYIVFIDPLGGPNQQRDTIQIASLPDDLDTAESVDITGQLLDVTGDSLAWSADSSELAILALDWLEAEKRTILHIYRYRLSEKRSREIFEYDDNNMGFVDSLSWSGDGKKLAFSIEYHPPGQVDLFVYHWMMGH